MLKSTWKNCYSFWIVLEVFAVMTQGLFWSPTCQINANIMRTYYIKQAIVYVNTCRIRINEIRIKVLQFLIRECSDTLTITKLIRGVAWSI